MSHCAMKPLANQEPLYHEVVGIKLLANEEPIDNEAVSQSGANRQWSC